MTAESLSQSAPPAIADYQRMRLDPRDDPFPIRKSAAGLYLSTARSYLSIWSDLALGRRINRDSNFVTDAYERHWNSTNENAAAKMARRGIHLWIGHRVAYVSRWFMYQYFTQEILEAATKVGAKSVLEVGSGWGANLALMALRQPDWEYAGLELTTNGVENSRALAQNLPPQFLKAAGVSELTEQRRTALKRISFQQGSATQLPFADKQFDVSFTSLVLEQIPRDYGRALDEMRRVTRRYCIFNEAFAEANSWLGMAHLKRVDYFHFSKEEWRKHGLEPVTFTTDLPQKLTFRTGLLVARVID